MTKKNLDSKIKIWHISDTHGFHKQLKVPEDVDIVLHSGDAGNYGDPYRNDPEINDFANWFAALPIMYKVYVAGNHDSAVEHRLWHKKLFLFLSNSKEKKSWDLGCKIIFVMEY